MGEVATVLSVLAFGVAIVRHAQAGGEWSWAAFGWVLLLTVAIGAPVIAAGTALALRLRDDHPMLGISLYLAMIFAAVAVIVLIARRIQAHYLPTGVAARRK